MRGFSQAPPKNDKPAPLVRIETVDTIETSQPKPFVGPVAAKESVVVVPRVSGFLEKVAFQEGSIVKKGDILFEIEDTVYKMNVKVSESVVRQIEAEIDLAKKDLERSTALRGNLVISEQELNQAQRNISLQEARRDEAKAALGLAENDLSYTKIVAPLSGRIGAKQFSEGNYITPNSGMLATIVQNDPITIKFSCSESDYKVYFHDAAESDKKANIQILCADKKLFEEKFKIDFIDNQVDRDTGTITIYLLCENGKGNLIPGGITTVLLSEKFEKPYSAVGISAILTDGQQNYVYVVDSAGVAKRRNIVTGPQVFDYYIVRSGLEPGEKVIVGGINKVKDGDKVRTMETPKKPTEVPETIEISQQ